MKKVIVLISVLFAFRISAQLNTYDYYREIKPVSENGFYKLKIGSGVIDRPGHYRVFEIGKDTLEVPHIIEEYDNSTYDKSYFRYLNIVDKSYIANKSSYATLVVDSGLTYSSVYLNFSAPEFFKNVTLEGSDDNKNWKTIIENEKVFHYFRPPFDHYYRNKISFSPVTFKYIRVITEDNDSPKLDISSAYIPLTEEVSNGDGELLPTGLIRTEDKAKKQTVIECSFRRMYFIGCLQIKVENEMPYRREVEVEFLTQNTGNDKWVVFGRSVISSNSSNKIYFKNYSSRDENFKTIKMRIIIHNLDDRPLGNIAIDAFTHEEILKCKLEKDKKYVLAYGKNNDALPQYDLQYFKNAIPLNLKYVETDAEKKISHATPEVQKPLFGNKLWIWIALTAGVLLIGIFTLKLLKQEDKQA
ncbi:MAG: hypothetical protein J0L69_13170 [Bacteroidetes bacterium]|nr:hypothetical protein [Bacteroidota bacterium]